MRRSVLYLPASNARAIDKVRTLSCDAFILDLEDAVAPEAKEIARRQAVAAVSAGGFGDREVVVRVNGLETPWGLDDCAALSEVRPNAVLMPKIDSPDAVSAYRSRLKQEIPLWAMIETCKAILRLDSIGACAKANRVAVFVLGTNDLESEMRCKPDADREALRPALSLAVMAARAYCLSSLDGVFNEVNDAAGFARQCRQAASLGFDGKTLVHPAQIAPANEAFAPGAEEVARAADIVAAFELSENATQGAILVNGRMVERLHLAQARRLLAVSGALNAQRNAAPP